MTMLARRRRPRRFRRPHNTRKIPKLMGPPLFGLVSAQDYRRVKGGCGYGDGEYSLGLRHLSPSVEIEVTTYTGRRPASSEEQMMLHQWFGRRIGELKEPTYPLVVTVNRWTQVIAVDGEPVAFTVIGDDAAWLACARVANRLVTIEALGRSPDQLALETVNPKDYADL